MRGIDAQTMAALASGYIAVRDFLWIEPRDRDTGQTVPFGFWSDVGTRAFDVIDPVTDAVLRRTYSGAGDLVRTGPVALAVGLAVQTVSITLSQLAPGALEVLRRYDLKRAPVELHRGWLDPRSRLQVAPALPFFEGVIDTAPLTTPAEGEEGQIALTAVSHAQELTRTNSATRSDADQRLREPTDGFFRHAAEIGNWRLFWGQNAK